MKNTSKKKFKGYFKYIDIIRIFAFIAVFLYHLNILKGGFLAVCLFFVLSGYLSIISAFNTEKFSLKNYYINKLRKIYIPMTIVVFITIGICFIIPNIELFNLKPEVNSIIFGYNNFWQIKAEIDYFVREAISPFIHLWYMSILLQFDLVFPFIYLILDKIEKTTKKIIPSIIMILLSIISIISFIIFSKNNSFIFTYYNTFSRLFSLVLGMTIGIIHNYYGQLIYKWQQRKRYSKTIFIIYLIILSTLFIFINYNSNYCVFCMIIVSLIGCRLIDYSTILNNNKDNIDDNTIRSLSDISYEAYLFQYPIIFILEYYNISRLLKIITVVIITLTISYIFQFALNNKNKKVRYLQYLILIIILGCSTYGCYKYITADDYTKEMKELEKNLEKKLEENNKRLEENLDNYNIKVAEEKKRWEELLENLENSNDDINDVINNLPILGIGDSVMLGATDILQEKFPNSYIDAKISRQIWDIEDILNKYSNDGISSEVVIINLGANGDCSISCKKKLMDKLEKKTVFWINTTNNIKFNNNLEKFANDYDNLYIIDWYSKSLGNEDYFYKDGIHLTKKGSIIYSNYIYDNIFDVYLKKYEQKKAETIKEYENNLKSIITFYGDTFLLNIYDEIYANYKEEKFIIEKHFPKEQIISRLQTSIENNSLSNNLVFIFGNYSNLNFDDYLELIELCKEYKIYIVSVTNDLSKLESYGATIIDFYSELTNNDSYLLADGQTLSEQGRKELVALITDNIIKE